jgi:hypothetical protein
MATITAMFLAADPSKQTQLALDEEVRAMTATLRAADYRDIRLISAWAVRPSDLQQLLLEHRPDIVHFSGHGTSDSALVLEDDNGPAPVSPAAMTSLFRAFKRPPRVVVLNACDSAEHAKALAGVVDCTIGMKEPIGDKAAAKFSEAFYRALGFGESLQTAFDLGKNAIALDGQTGADIPALFHRPAVDPSSLRMAGDHAVVEPQEPSPKAAETDPKSKSRGPWWALAAAALTGLAALTAMLVDLGNLVDRVWRGSPTIDFVASDQAFPSLTYKPGTRTLRFAVPFTIEHKGGRNEIIEGVEGTFVSRGVAILSFSTTDISCSKDGSALSAITAGAIGRATCELEHTLSDTTFSAMQAPGPSVLELRFVGRYRNDYRVRYCLKRSDEFWGSFLNSPADASRRILDPKNCQ